jgi:hypothetical protein
MMRKSEGQSKSPGLRLMKNPRQQGFVKGHNFSCANKVNRINGL